MRAISLYMKEYMLTHDELLKYCNAAYEEDLNLFESRLGIHNKTRAYFGESLHKYTVELDDCYVIVFRGSENKYDWVNDMLVRTTDFGHTQVHQGFLDCLDSQPNPRFYYDKPIYITGHSLGGALAILEAYRLISMDTEIKEVVTFGCPKVGAKSFQERYNSKLFGRTTMYVNGNDIVPLLPPFRYYQVGYKLQIGDKLSWYNPLKYIGMFTDHIIENYSNSMKGLP